MARILGVGVLRCDTSCWPRCCVAVISRAADHCVTGLRQQVETFGRLEHLVGMRGWRNLAREAVFDMSSLKKKPVAAVPVSVTGSIS